MKISFDLDGTLIPSDKDEFAVVPRNYVQKICRIEELRFDSQELFRQLQLAGHQVGIYTTSYRSKLRIRCHLLSYGIWVDFIINEKLNRKRLAELGISASKYAKAFDIDLHIDDSPGVAKEGERLEFNTIIIKGDQSNWAAEIMRKVADNRFQC